MSVLMYKSGTPFGQIAKTQINETSVEVILSAPCKGVHYK